MVDRERPTPARHIVSLWLALAAISAYLCRQCLGVVEKTIREDLLLSEEQMGVLMGIFFWAYALAQIPAGWLGDRYGSRAMMAIYSLVWSLGTACWGIPGGFALLFAGRVGVGVAQAGVFPCAVRTISLWHPATERGTASGILAASMQVGALIAAFLTAKLVYRWDIAWQAVFVLYAVPGVLWSVGFFAWFRNTPQEYLAPPEHSAVPEDALVENNVSVSGTSDADVGAVPWGRLILSPAMWMICMQQFFRAAGYVWFASWFPTYLQETRGVTQEKAGGLLAIPLLASLVASLFSGGTSDLILRRTGSRVLARKGLAAGSLLVCAALVFGAYFVEDATAAAGMIGMGAFCAAFAGPCAYSVTIDMGGRYVTPVFATMNMIGNFGAGILAWFAPVFRRFIEDDSELLALFGGNSWNAILVLFASMYALAAMFWLMLNVEGTVFDSEEKEVES